MEMQCLRKLSVPVSDNPERNLDLNDNIDELTKIIPDNKEINYNTWKRVDGEKNIKKMKLVNVKKSEFIGIIKTELEDFRMRLQNEGTVSTDETFKGATSSESHDCSHGLHPAVAYIKRDGSLQHRSFVVISNELAHNTSTVWSILDILIPQLKQIVANLEYIHYLTDSSSSQYRNKHIFHVIANHLELFNVAARDGLGGATKRFVAPLGLQLQPCVKLHYCG
ncbi:hypothetical protein SNE40_000452 [Patella caerulea]|uniref:Uncharacterized protein n=1 Tax=Patella caerulea TaxID=87958 RepID=A0AAN8Q296_PATCE